MWKTQWRSNGDISIFQSKLPFVWHQMCFQRAKQMKFSHAHRTRSRVCSINKWVENLCNLIVVGWPRMLDAVGVRVFPFYYLHIHSIHLFIRWSVNALICLCRSFFVRMWNDFCLSFSLFRKKRMEHVIRTTNIRPTVPTTNPLYSIGRNNIINHNSGCSFLVLVRKSIQSSVQPFDKRAHNLSIFKWNPTSKRDGSAQMNFLSGRRDAIIHHANFVLRLSESLLLVTAHNSHFTAFGQKNCTNGDHHDNERNEKKNIAKIKYTDMNGEWTGRSAALFVSTRQFG